PSPPSLHDALPIWSAAPDRCRDLQLRPADGRPFVGAEALVLRPADDLRGVPARPDRTAAVHRDPARAPRPLHRPARRPRLGPPPPDHPSPKEAPWISSSTT